MCLRLREQCLRSKITSVARSCSTPAFCRGNMDVNTPASKRSQLIGNTAIVRQRRAIHKKSTCVCLRLSVGAFTRKRRDARFDLWPALGFAALLVFSLLCPHLAFFSLCAPLSSTSHGSLDHIYFTFPHHQSKSDGSLSTAGAIASTQIRCSNQTVDVTNVDYQRRNTTNLLNLLCTSCNLFVFQIYKMTYSF